uniref:glucuronosyltransferase n=1 Tax=Panagrellus redivivus TaxID=6233 RepID=A0A7E4VCT0_PANRE
MYLSFRVFLNIVAVFLAVESCVNAARIAVLNNFFGHSHFAFLSNLADILAENGHDVTVIVAEANTSAELPFPHKANLLVRDLPPPLNHMVAHESPKQQQTLWKEQYNFIQQHRNVDFFIKLMNAQCERFLSDSLFVEKVRNQKYDFALIEPTDYCGYGMIKLAGIPAYANSLPLTLSGVHGRALGLGGNSLESYSFTTSYHPEMTFYERVWDVLLPFYDTVIKGVDARMLGVDIVRKYADPEFTPEKAIANGRFLFLNTEEHIDFPRPITHKIVYIGGIMVDSKSSDALPDEYKEIFDNAKKGVVFVSFGSAAKSRYMPTHIKDAFLQLFAAFPEISFIWKYEDPDDTIGNDLPNLFKKTWVPQKELLPHPRLLAFVTHGGMNSVLEATFSGVSLLGIPLFADQMRNIKMLEYRESAVSIHKEAVTGKSLIAAMHKLTDTDSYRKHAQELAALAKSNPQSPKERFLTHMENAIKFAHTKDYLDIGHREFNTVRYYNLDVYAFLTLVVIVTVSIVLLVVSTVFKVVRYAFGRVVGTYRKKND